MDAIVPKPMLTRREPMLFALAMLVIVVATIAGAFAFEAAGYPPCELCLKERLPYYAGMLLAAGTVALAWRGPRPAFRAGFAILAVLFLFSAGFGAWHAGVEWGFWAGPADCTGTLRPATSNADFLHQLETIRVVRCDAVAIRILGLSLAGWNAIVSLAVAILATYALRRSAKPWSVGH